MVTKATAAYFPIIVGCSNAKQTCHMMELPGAKERTMQQKQTQPSSVCNLQTASTSTPPTKHTAYSKVKRSWSMLHAAHPLLGQRILSIRRNHVIYKKNTHTTANAALLQWLGEKRRRTGPKLWSRTTFPTLVKGHDIYSTDPLVAHLHKCLISACAIAYNSSRTSNYISKKMCIC